MKLYILIGSHLHAHAWRLPADIVKIDLGNFFNFLLLFILLPFVISRIVRKFHHKNTGPFSISFFQNLQVGALIVVFISMFTVSGERIITEAYLFPKVIAALLGFFIAVFLIAKIMALAASLPREEYILLNFTASARNSPIALAVALSVFPAKPIVATVIILAPLI